jgi:hypothetical protein
VDYAKLRGPEAIVSDWNDGMMNKVNGQDVSFLEALVWNRPSFSENVVAVEWSRTVLA